MSNLESKGNHHCSSPNKSERHCCVSMSLPLKPAFLCRICEQSHVQSLSHRSSKEFPRPSLSTCTASFQIMRLHPNATLQRLHNFEEVLPMYHRKKYRKYVQGIFFWNIWILNITGRLQRWRCIGRIGRHVDNILENA